MSPDIVVLPWMARCAVAYHNVLKKGFTMMHTKTKLEQMKVDFEEANTSMSASDFFSSSVLPGASAELHRRAMGIRAWKAFQWLCRDDTLLALLVLTATVSPLETVMFRFLQWQTDESFLRDDATSPLAVMSTEQSPAVAAVDELLSLMVTGALSKVSNGASLHDIAEGLFDTFNLKFYWRWKIMTNTYIYIVTVT